MVSLGFHHSEETKQKISESQKGNKYRLGTKHSEETKKKLSELNKGENNPIYGVNRVFTEEWKKNISKSNKGRCFSEIHKKNMSKSALGVPKSESHKKSMSLALIGKLSWLKGLTKETDSRVAKISKLHIGMHLSEETKKKISNSIKKDIKNTERLRNMIIKRPTKPQLKLFEVVKSRFLNNDVCLEYPIKTTDGTKFIDVAIPSLKIGFEWDEPYWHQDKIKDIKRHNLIQSQGWKLIHFENISF